MNEEILKIIKEKGLLLEKEIFEMLQGFSSAESVREFLNELGNSGEKIITKSYLHKNSEYVQNFVNKMQKQEKSSLEKVLVKLVSLEITKERESSEANEKLKEEGNLSYKIFYSDTKNSKKLEVGDFIGNFRSRYQHMQRILMQRQDLSNLVSINKISGERQQISIIGMVKDKRTTKNKNLIIALEDLTGEINVLVRKDRGEVFNLAQELQLDDVIAIKASGDRNMLFVNKLYFPDSFLQEKTKFDEEIHIAFLSDVHAGGGKHLKRSMEKFLEWLNSDNSNAVKIKYIFFVGDNVDGVGIFPGQENLLELKSMKEQYSLLASYLRKIPKSIQIFMCPGQHDAVRVAEPQPILSREYAGELYEIENLTLVTNPAMVKILEGNKEFKVLMYHGASIHSFINEIPELREMKAHKTPAKAVTHMLKRRHLAPTHSSVVYIPNAEKDPLIIREAPDVLCTGEVHRPDIENYNGTLIITGSCWQAQTAFEEKVGNIPDPGKVPVLNLKTRELKVFDFLDEKELEEVGGRK